MAKSDNFFDLNKKVGPIVFCKGKDGYSYVKQYKSTIRNPKTRFQTENRLKLARFSNIAKEFKKLVRISYPNPIINSYTDFFKTNYKKTTQGSAPDYHIEFDKFLVSKGNLDPPLITETWIDHHQAELTFDNVIGVRWENQEGYEKFQSPNDRVAIVIYNEKINVCYYEIYDRTFRFMKLAHMLVPNALRYLDANVIIAWIFFISENGNEVSNSIYLGNFTLQ